ncbi:MAG: DUF2281 domain-containing protein [Geitlerinemataceae cyanobacterium]
MTTQEKIVQELEQIPEGLLTEILDFIRTLKNKSQVESADREIWQAYLASKSDRQEVYRRLANS